MWKKIVCVFACVRLILVLVGGRQTAVVVVCTYYVPDTYVPGISRLPRYVCTWYQPADERSARGRTRLTTAQLSLVVATATVFP